MNFHQKFIDGQQGFNLGLSTGLSNIDKHLYGVQRAWLYGVAAPPKAGKTAFVDFSFLVMPYLQSLTDPSIEVEWVYFSFEINRVAKEFRLAALFFYLDYNITQFDYKGHSYPISTNYLLGRLRDHEDEPILVSPEHTEILRQIYVNRIIPLFGRYSISNKLEEKGLITFVETRSNPTGLYKMLLEYAAHRGTFHQDESEFTAMRSNPVQRYVPHRPKKYIIVITDHIRKLYPERGYSLKQAVDKYSDYCVQLRDLCGFTFVNVCHINRNFLNSDRLRSNKEFLYPTGEDVKETGNLGEDSNVLLTLFNPLDEKYNITRHFGRNTEEIFGYRSLHVVEGRDVECPLHFGTQYFGNLCYFKPIQ